VSTLAWLLVLWLVASLAFLAGYVVRVEFERWQRASGELLDFTRRRIGT
jgi:hypothetical protein